ncbi:unnamed protein product [Mortierella alpina]
MAAPLSGHTMTKVSKAAQLLVAGGESSAPVVSPITLFDTAGGGSWTAPPMSKNDTTSFHRLYHASVTTGKDGALLHGGYLSAPTNGTVVPSLVTLKDSNKFVPFSGSPVSLARNAPALARHTMTLTTDGQAVILGGVNSQGAVANLSVAYILDTQAQAVDAEWKAMPLSGDAPEPRMSFSTVLVNATTMLVFGGTADSRSALSGPYYLDLPTWTWSSPAAEGVAPQRWGHTATMAGNFMVVAFGKQRGTKKYDVPIAPLPVSAHSQCSIPVQCVPKRPPCSCSGRKKEKKNPTLKAERSRLESTQRFLLLFSVLCRIRALMPRCRTSDGSRDHTTNALTPTFF